jgi:hypothetical protein
MSNASLTAQVVTAAESAASSGIDPWFVGIGTFALLLALLAGLLAFAGGRDHS